MTSLNLGAISAHATPEEADKLLILIAEFNLMLLSIKKMKMTKVRLLHELEKSPENINKRLKLKRLLDDIDRYHGKATQKKGKIIRIVQGIKWREENKKRGLT